MAKTQISEVELFTANWGRRFCLDWNRQPDLWPPFKGLGRVNFVKQEEGAEYSLILNWGADGSVSIADAVADQESIPSFCGSHSGWSKFMFRSLSPVQAVLAKVIVFRGPILFALQHGNKFSSVRDLAARITLSRDR